SRPDPTSESALRERAGRRVARPHEAGHEETTMRDVAIIGVGMIKFGRYPEKTVPELAGQAALLALKDAGVDMKDIELLASGNLYQSNAMVGQRIMQTIGQTGIPVINVANACATGSTAFREAYYAVASGAYDMTLAVGSE